MTRGEMCGASQAPKCRVSVSEKRIVQYPWVCGKGSLMKYVYEPDCECCALYDHDGAFIAYVPCWRHRQDSTAQQGAEHEYAH